MKIKDAFRNPTIENEKVPSKEELSKLIRASTLRGRCLISLIAFSGLRIDMVGNFKGNDGLVISDLQEMKITNRMIAFEKVPTIVKVGSNLGKA